MSTKIKLILSLVRPHLHELKERAEIKTCLLEQVKNGRISKRQNENYIKGCCNKMPHKDTKDLLAATTNNNPYKTKGGGLKVKMRMTKEKLIYIYIYIYIYMK